jgi:hypothetical protein
LGPELKHVLGTFERLVPAQKEKIVGSFVAWQRGGILRENRAVVENMDLLRNVESVAELAGDYVGDGDNAVKHGFGSGGWTPVLAGGVVDNEYALGSIRYIRKRRVNRGAIVHEEDILWIPLEPLDKSLWGRRTPGRKA